MSPGLLSGIGQEIVRALLGVRSFEMLPVMPGASYTRDVSRTGLVVVLLVLSLVLAGILAWEAQASIRQHRIAAEKVLMDYALVAADEFARRSVVEVGYSGFYPIVTAVRQEAAKGRLVDPAELRADPAGDALRASLDLLGSTFSYDVATGRLLFSAPDPRGTVFPEADSDGALRAWISRRLREEAESLRHEAHYAAAHAVVDHSLRSIVFGRAMTGSNLLLAGFVVNERALPTRFQQAAVKDGPLLPSRWAQGAVTHDALFLRVLDPTGTEVFRMGAPRTPYLAVQRPYGDDYNGILSGFMIEAAMDPAAASALVIGGLPRSRLPLILGILALAFGLVAVAAFQFRREQALSQLRSQFISRTSHELRTPLTQIRLFAETLVMNRTRNEQELRRALEVIDRESRRLTHLIDNILRFSRGERGEDRVDLSPQDAIPLVREILLHFEPLIAGRARIDVCLPETAMANLDADAFRRVVSNLLDNAIKYGPSGQTIRVRASVTAEKVLVSVEDQGPGIPSSERDRIWERFYRIRRDRESPVTGTGIGLSIVAELVRSLNGRAWVEDSNGGARFVIEFDAVRPSTEGVAP
jgi:signal transduction histidine kinase